uniref:Uncharacterized protein n=1 Tax=Schizaphis graminum TaxID=13262 RepID=A0A2S2NM29_SCHGA
MIITCLCINNNCSASIYSFDNTVQSHGARWLYELYRDERLTVFTLFVHKYQVFFRTCLNILQYTGKTRQTAIPNKKKKNDIGVTVHDISIVCKDQSTKDRKVIVFKDVIS